MVMKITRLALAILFVLVQSIAEVHAEPTERPNILCLVCEDISPYLGCYGDQQAHTPNLDQLASEGVLFTRAYSNAPVCAVARSTLLTGMYASTIGTQHMRSRPVVPDNIPVYPRVDRNVVRHNGARTHMLRADS